MRWVMALGVTSVEGGGVSQKKKKKKKKIWVEWLEGGMYRRWGCVQGEGAEGMWVLEGKEFVGLRESM